MQHQKKLHQKVYWWRHKFQFFKQKNLLLFAAKETSKIETSFYEKDTWNLSEMETQPAFTYSKLTIESLMVSLMLTYFTPCSSVSNVNFEHVIAGWEE